MNNHKGSCICNSAFYRFCVKCQQSVEKNRVYYFISVVGNLVQSDLQLNWRKSICKHLGLSYKAYNSKYKEAVDSENPRTVDFRERLEEFIKSFDELAKAS